MSATLTERQLIAAAEQLFAKLGTRVTIESQRDTIAARPTWTIHTQVDDTLAVGQAHSLTDALSDLRAADPQLTAPQADRLMMIAAAKNGESHHPQHSVIRALVSRGYITGRHCRVHPGHQNFIATPVGLDIDERRRARLGSHDR